ncbi:unnamed protein product, partial [Prorocentrum cordatum]
RRGAAAARRRGAAQDRPETAAPGLEAQRAPGKRAGTDEREMPERPAAVRRRLCSKTADGSPAETMALRGPLPAPPPPGDAPAPAAAAARAGEGAPVLPPGAIVPLPLMVPAGLSGLKAKEAREFFGQAAGGAKRVVAGG